MLQCGINSLIIEKYLKVFKLLLSLLIALLPYMNNNASKQVEIEIVLQLKENLNKFVTKNLLLSYF